MGLHHRHKQRVLTTLAMLIILTVALDILLLSAPSLGLELALLLAFTAAIGLTTAYQCYNYRHSHEHLTLVNTLTQIFLGSVLFASCLAVLALHILFGTDIIESSLVPSVLVLILTFAFLRKFDEHLENEVQSRFPMASTPSPGKPKGARKER